MRFLFVVFSFIYASSSLAGDCLSPLPNAVSLLQAKTESNKLSKSQQQSANRLFQELATQWRGSGSGYYCVGEELAQAEKKYKKIDVKLDFNNHQKLVLKAQKRSKDTQQHAERLGSLNIFADKGYLRFDQNNSAGDVWLETLSSTDLSVWSQTRSGTVYHLINRKIKRSSNRLEITITQYSNNRLTSRYSANLTR